MDKLAATKDKRCFYLPNHQTELDWIFMSYFLQVYDREADFSAVMKSSLGYFILSSSFHLEKSLL